MHIAIDGTPAVNDIRAIQRYTGNLIKGLAEIDQESFYSILYLGYKPGISSVPPMTPNANFHARFSSVPGKLLKVSWALSSFPRFSFWTGGKADVVHFPGGYAYIPTSGETVITTLHGFPQQLIPEHMNPVERSSVIANLEKTIRDSSFFITVSENNKNELIQLWSVPEERITAIPLGISPEFAQLAISDEQRSLFLKKYHVPNKPFVLYIGALEPHKNIEGIINAYALSGQTIHRNFNLVFIGAETCHSSKYRQLIAKLNIAEQVFFVNYITPGSCDLSYFYNLAALFVFPTFYEGWASPPLESMKCGTPALVSGIPSLKESTGGVASYCNPSDPEDIANKMKMLLEDDKLFVDQKNKGLEFASGITWRKCAMKTLELYRKLSV